MAKIRIIPAGDVLTPIRFVIRRESNDENTFAVVCADVVESLIRQADFLEQLREGVTEWVKTTKEGEVAWHRSSKDFNVGDLDHHTKSAIIKEILSKRGIHNLRIVTNSGLPRFDSGQWTFDTVLVEQLND